MRDPPLGRSSRTATPSRHIQPRHCVDVRIGFGRWNRRSAARARPVTASPPAASEFGSARFLDNVHVGDAPQNSGGATSGCLPRGRLRNQPHSSRRRSELVQQRRENQIDRQWTRRRPTHRLQHRHRGPRAVTTYVRRRRSLSALSSESTHGVLDLVVTRRATRRECRLPNPPGRHIVSLASAPRPIAREARARHQPLAAEDYSFVAITDVPCLPNSGYQPEVVLCPSRYGAGDMT